MLQTVVLLALLGALAWPAAPAAATQSSLTPAEAQAAHAWRGRSCTPAGCGPAPAATAGSVLGFGVSALGAGWLARRRDRGAR